MEATDSHPSNLVPATWFPCLPEQAFAAIIGTGKGDVKQLIPAMGRPYSGSAINHLINHLIDHLGFLGSARSKAQGSSVFYPGVLHGCK